MTVASAGVLPEPGSLLEGQAHLLERIARGAPLPDILVAVTRLIERHVPGATASILLLGDDRKLRTGAAPSLPDSFSAAVDGLTIGPNTGSCGAAAYHNRAVISPDILIDPIWKDYRDFLQSYGLRAAWSTPIQAAGGSVVGTFALYYREPHTPAPGEQELVAVATSLAGIAIERRRAEEQLRVGEERLRLVGKATHDAVWDWHLVAGTLWWGDGARALLGTALDELEVGIESWTSRIHSEDRDRVVAGIHAVIESGGRSWSDEYRFQRGDGSFADIFDRGYVIRDEAGRPVRMVGSMMDVTERARAHQALAHRERQFREAQRVARVGSWEVDLAQQSVHWSDEMYRMYGLNPDEFRPTSDSITALVTPADRPMMAKAYERCTKERRPFAYDLRIHHCDGQIRILHCRGHPVVDADGVVLRVLGTAQDVTDRRQTEERLRESQRRLRALTARREAILEEERARISREIHDELGQILTASKLDVAWVRDSLPAAPDEIRTRLADLASRLDATVKTVRRITTELRPVVLDQLGLAPAVEWLARDFAHRTGLACSVRANLEAHVLPRETSTALFRILQEALTNVARHAGAGAVRVELWAVDHTVCLAVSDDGRGISGDEVSRADGLGIMGMRERAILLGGALELSPIQPSGTRLSVWAPIQ